MRQENTKKNREGWVQSFNIKKKIMRDKENNGQIVDHCW